MTGDAAPPTSKEQWRERLSAARRARGDDERERARAAVRTAVLAEVAVHLWDCVAAYEPLRTEPGSLELLHDLHATGVRVLVPVTLPDRDLDWFSWTPAGHGAPLGLDGIAAADAVLVPALAVARGGTRLGRGGGSYDRALPRTVAGTPRLALLFEGELLDTLPRDPWDQPVTGVVTPSGRHDV